MLHLVLAEAALETVPKGIRRHPAVRAHARRRGKSPGEILLDRSYHHSAMKGLPMAEKRGRPDIAHICLLEALGSPLNKGGLLRVYVHTIGGYVIYVNPEVRLPRNYDRFVGLIEQLFKTGSVPPGEEEWLLKVRRGRLRDLVEEVNPTLVVAFSTDGEPATLSEVCRTLVDEENPMALVGAFPRGSFTSETEALVDRRFRIDPEALEAWVVVSRLIYQYEVQIGLPEKRVAKLRGS